jgi:shikimate 5-dehydrogenase/shikimate kinase
MAVPRSQGPSRAADSGCTKQTSVSSVSLVTDVPEAPSPSQFSHRASIVLVGGKGAGKSSLAVIASTTLNRSCIDGDDYFHQKTGMSRSQYKQKNGTAEYARLELRIMHSLLYHHTTDSVIVFGISSITTRGGQLLVKYAKTHPVIHVVRDLKSVLRHLGTSDQGRITRLHDLSEPFFRSVANCEFHNLSEDFEAMKAGRPWHETSAGHAPMRRSEYPFLRLKRVEVEFMRFLHIVLGERMFQQHQPYFEDSYDLAWMLRSSHTYVLSLSLSELQGRVVVEEGFNCGADAFELRVDFHCPDNENVPSSSISMLEDISRLFAVLRRHFDGPIIYHVETSCDLPISASYSPRSSAEDTQRYLELLRHGLRLAPEFITVNLKWADPDVLGLLATRNNIKLIGHYHNSSPWTGAWNSPSQYAMYDRALSMRCDLVRLTQPATSAEDNFDALQFANRINRSKPANSTSPYLSAYNTGTLGRTSCCFNQIFTPICSQEAQQQNVELCDGHDLSPSLTLQQAQKSIYSGFVHNSLKFWVVGTDVSYSLSPAMHNAAYKSCGIPHQFGIRQISDITELQGLVKDPHLGGCSIAEGFRISILPLLHSMSPHAKAIGAVNTLIPIRTYFWDPAEPPPLSFYHQRNQAGPVVGLYGDNTDWIGIQRCVRQFLSPANAICQATTALVIGAGAVARASIYALLRLGVQRIMLWNRTPENTTVLAEHFNRFGSNIDSTGDNDTSKEAEMTTASSMCTNRVETINSLDQEWPPGYKQPTVIVSCVPARANLVLPSNWLKSPTGGVVVDVSREKPFQKKFQLITSFIVGIQTSTHSPINADSQPCTKWMGDSGWSRLSTSARNSSISDLHWQEITQNCDVGSGASRLPAGRRPG